MHTHGCIIDMYILHNHVFAYIYIYIYICIYIYIYICMYAYKLNMLDLVGETDD